MSIKLYDGYQIIGDVADSLSVQREWVMGIRERIQSEVQRKALADVVQVAVFAIDTKVVWSEEHVFTRMRELLELEDWETKIIPYVHAMEYCNRRNEKDGFYKSSAILLRSKNKTLALFYGNRKLCEIWESNPQVQQYGYWNNTNMPDEVTEEEWGERYQNWSEAFDGSDAWLPSEVGWSVTFSDGLPLTPLDDEAVNIIPTKEKRAKYQAKAMIWYRLTKEMGVEKLTMDDSRNVSHELKEKFRTEFRHKLKNEWEVETAKIQELLSDITTEILMEKILLAN